MTCVVDLVNVWRFPVSHAVIYPISFLAVATDDFEIVFVIKLSSLVWGKPISQKPPAASFPGILGKKVPVQLAYSIGTGVNLRQRHPQTANALLAQMDRPYDPKYLIPEITVLVRDTIVGLKRTLAKNKSGNCKDYGDNGVEAGMLRRRSSG